jgi:hypothetical protein
MIDPVYKYFLEAEDKFNIFVYTTEFPEFKTFIQLKFMKCIEC